MADVEVAESELELLRVELKLHTGISQFLFSHFSIVFLKESTESELKTSYCGWNWLESRKFARIK